MSGANHHSAPKVWCHLIKLIPYRSTQITDSGGESRVEEGARLGSPLRLAVCLGGGVAVNGTPEIVSDCVPISG